MNECLTCGGRTFEVLDDNLERCATCLVPRFRPKSGPGLARRDHPDTSKAAAASVAETSGKDRSKVYRAIQLSGPMGMTDEELQLGLGMNQNSERPRRVELVNAGLVCDSEGRRKTSRGRMAIVWIATPAAAPAAIPEGLFEP